MKTILYITCLLGLALGSTNASYGQTITAGKAGKFGIDGDISSDTALSGMPKAQMTGSHDWFQKVGGTGIGLFDTTGAACAKKHIMNGENFPFTKSMQYGRYATVDGNILMDAAYARDYIGLNNTPIDKTTFSTTKNQGKFYDDPSTWVTAPSDGTIPSKSDIIDAYVHMRRDGTTFTNTSHLMLYAGISTLATDGNHYVSFLFSKERMEYDTTTGKFSNSGPAATGGHSAWTFNTDGSVKGFGDLSISFAYDGSGLSSIQILIWVGYNDFSKTKPTKFAFSGQWDGASSNSGYGWAAVVPAGTTPLKVWGAVSTANTAAPLWGTNSKDLGASGSNYVSTQYSPGQFGEAAIDLTVAGIDPVLYTDYNACNPPFTRYFVVTRSSSSSSSSMQDFTGPYPFLDAPAPPATIVTPGVFTCANNSPMDLSADNYTKGVYYSWSTPNGKITGSNADSSVLKISKPGTYTLYTSFAQGCTQASTSVVVGGDYYQPVAKATNSGIPTAGGFATLYGGDPDASNYQTPYGGSKGLSFAWSGPIKSTLQNPITTKLGTYQLIVTEARNGCKDTAFTTVNYAVDSSNLRLGTLAVKFTAFDVNVSKQQRTNNLSWAVADAKEVNRFVVEKSVDGKTFSVAGYVFASPSATAYGFKDLYSEAATYYRIKAVEVSQSVSYTSILRVSGSGGQASTLKAYSNGAGSLVIDYTSPAKDKLHISLLSMSGQAMKQFDHAVAEGSNVFKLDDLGRVSTGIYLLQLQSANGTATVKVKL